MSDNLIAWVVNPKTGELFVVFCDEGGRGDVTVTTVDGERIARGTLRDQGSLYNRCEERTGYPRAHTMDALSTGNRGKGLGTVLYTGLVCAVVLEDDLRLSLRVTKPGVCSSTYSRSTLADAWWDRAVDRYGIAKRTESEGKFECPDDEDVAYDECMGKSSCDVYAYKRAKDAGLVVMISDSDAGWIEQIDEAEAGDFSVVSTTALAALNTGVIRERFGETRQDEAFALMAFLDASAKMAKVSSLAREEMRVRFLAGVDGHAPITGLEGTMPRENPTTRRGRTPKGYVIKRYGTGARHNPEDTGAVASAVEHAVDLRKKLGWGAWMDEKYSP